jgi:2-polyprenyl-3-methyl-5-hydroxy-6-metoxy-1,4-benzoquinol methylase
MKNITEQKPTHPLSGRTFWVSKFVDPNDIKGKSVLDIGCGYGWFEYLSLGWGVKHITGTELGEQDLTTAKKYLQDKKVDFTVGSAIDLPFKQKTFDTVVSWEVIEHIPKLTESKMFSEVGRILKSNGVFYLSTPHRHPLSTALDPAFWLIGHRHYTLNELRKYATQAGFKVDKMTIRGRMWEVTWLLNLYTSKWIFRRTPVSEEYFNKK